MLPPHWATNPGTRLSINDFETEFERAWSRLARRFLKLECWQTYQEQDWNRSHDAFKAGDLHLATDLLKEEAEQRRSVYDEIKTRELDFTRIRLVTLPLTSYLEYEIINYRIRSAMGETIEMVLLSPGTALPNDEYFDFLLFDDNVALVHDYGLDGFQVGGWLVEEPDVVRRLEETALRLRCRSTPVAEFLRTISV